MPPGDFAILDTSEFVVLLPEIRLEDFDRGQKSQNSGIASIKRAI
jgi:hypothetical protein